MTKEDYQKISDEIPKEPGIYKYIDEKEVILYVGKAKSLKNRISSYFSDSKGHSQKTRVMIKAAHHIDFFVVNTESDALLLENTLIKQHQPRYNVMLKDGKSYVYLCIKKESFPRVFLTRRVIKDGSHYFGPYISKFRIEQLLEVIKKLFKLRSCALNLTQANIQANKFKVCLEYHIKNCEGPCIGYETEESYKRKIEAIKNILKGQITLVRESMKSQMLLMSEMEQFEEAQKLKDNLVFLEEYQGKSTVVSTTINDVDVFAMKVEDDDVFVQYLKVVEGAIVNTFTQEMARNIEEDEDSLLVFAVETLREKFSSNAIEIIVPFEIPVRDPGILVTVPKIGDKKKLVELAEKNLHLYYLQKRKSDAERAKKQTSAERILTTLKTDLQLSKIPLHIECFDNSNIQGSDPVSSCVVYKNAKPANKEYRYFNVKTVEGPDDFASMEEVVYRRYLRILNEGKNLPDLIIIDGGKGQLSSAVKSLTLLGIYDKVSVIGIAKKLEEIFFPEDPLPLYINKKSESLQLIQRIRNEAHRFAITFHRNQRSKNFIKTALTNIPGIGKITSEKLLTQFKSIQNIKNAQREEIVALIGAKATQTLFENLESY